MRVKTVPISWVDRWGARLDCGPFLSGAIEAKIRLEQLRRRALPLRELVEEPYGIYKGKLLRRLFVNDSKYGVPFLTSSGMLRADLSHAPKLSRRIAADDEGCLVTQGMTMISAAGTIGRTVYGRSDMEGMFASSDIIKIRPRKASIPSGYLFAFLSSRFGLGLVTAGTYGSIIQHLDPVHISDLPIPRFAESIEHGVHELIERAATLRSSASAKLEKVSARFDETFGAANMERASPLVSIVPSSQIGARMDAQFHDPIVKSIQGRIKEGRHVTIGDWCTRVYLPGIFKRIHIDSGDHGAPYFTGASLFWLEPLPKGILSRRTTLFDQVLLRQGTVLVQAFGQEGGLTGRPVWVGKHLDGVTTTHMLVRLETTSKERSAFLFGFLQSEVAYRQISSLTYGGSIPHFDEKNMAQVILPLFSDKEMTEVSTSVIQAVEARDQALDLEKKARATVEMAIEEATNWRK
ncbi:MAG: hypothetical protein KF804_00920 [Burkholderiales bacterium]|nr:hypothetical protein [Burkholderiales bacterium]